MSGMIQTQAYENFESQGQRYEFEDDSEASEDLLEPMPSDQEPRPQQKAPKTFRKNSRSDMKTSFPLQMRKGKRNGGQRSERDTFVRSSAFEQHLREKQMRFK